MKTHTIDGVKLSEEIYKLVRAKAEKGIRRGQGEPKKVTIAEVCAMMIGTGVLRRLAANKWANAHPAKAHPKKTKKSPAKASKKPAKARKAKKTARKSSSKAEAAPAANGAAPAAQASAPAGGVLD